METDRIRLRPWQESDAEALFKYASDPEVSTRAGWKTHQSVEESLEIIRTVFSNDYTWAIELKETHEAIGTIGYYTHDTSNIHIGTKDCEVGYWIGKPYWNLGIATEALRLMIHHCINVMHFETIWADHFMGNVASGRVMEKCGFKDTGMCNHCSNLLGGDKDMVKIYKLDVKNLCLNLALEVFMEFEAPVYPQEGIEEFKQALKNPDYTNLLTFYALMHDNTIVGMLATRNQGSHIALFFVKTAHQGKGIGRTLYEMAANQCPTDFMTVFSSPYAIPIYKALGFEATDDEQIDNGVRYTPMRKQIRIL